MSDMGLSIVDLVKLKRAQSLEQKMLKEAVEEEKHVNKLKKKLEKRRKKHERKKKDKERILKGNEELVNVNIQTKSKENIISKSVNFHRNLEQIKNISPLPSDSQIDLDDTDFSDDNVKKVVPLSPQRSPLPKRTRCQSKYPLNDLHIEQVESSNLNFLSSASYLTSNLKPNEFSLPKEFTSLKLEKVREKKLLEDSLLGPTQLVNIINDEDHEEDSSKNKDHVASRRKRLDISQESQRQILVSKYQTVIAIIFVKESSLKVAFVQDGEVKREIGPVTIETSFNQPYVEFSKDRISVKEFRILGNQIEEHKFNIIGIEEDFSEFRTSSQITPFLTEIDPRIAIDRLRSMKLGEKKIVIFYTVGDMSKGSLIYSDEDNSEVKHFGSIKGKIEQLLKMIGSHELFLSSTTNKVYLWNYLTGNCIKIINNSFSHLIGCFKISSRIIALSYDCGHFTISLLTSHGWKETIKIQHGDDTLVDLSLMSDPWIHENKIMLLNSRTVFSLCLKKKSITKLEVNTVADILPHCIFFV